MSLCNKLKLDQVTMSYIRFRYIMPILLLLHCLVAGAQKISVTNFYLLESDLTANGRNAEIDQNGDKCALIKVQTTQKGFLFDVGSAGITKVDDKHAGEIWIWVPYGVKHISIRHEQLGSMPNYIFPINIDKARTYIMEITHDQIFVNKYDDTRKQMLRISVTPANSTFTLNGMNVVLDDQGNAEQELSFGRYTYKIMSEGYYPKEGQIEINDSLNKQSLIVNDLKPIMGKLNIKASPESATIIVDGHPISGNSADLQIGNHQIKISAVGYRTEERSVVILENQITELEVSLSQTAIFQFTSTPSEVHITIDKQAIGTTPCFKELVTGTYTVKATKAGYKDYQGSMVLSSSTPSIAIHLNKIYNYRNAFYAEANIRAGSMIAFGGTIGGYVSNVNVEAAYLIGTGNSETIYWSGNNTQPIVSNYTPTTNISAKLGYGFALGTRYRLTPQVGVNMLKLKESIDNSSSAIADEANVASALLSLRFSVAIVNHFEISITPEMSFAVSKSKGYEKLSEVSSKIKQWGEGFNVKLGLSVFI